jgi:hypothetical protein
METLNSIPGIGKSSLELLEAAGFLDVESIARSDAAELASELKRANSILHIASETPTLEMVVDWITTAREISGIQEEEKEQPVSEDEPVDYEESPEVAAMLQGAPFAIPLPARLLMARELAVSDIPPAILLNSYSGEFDVRTGQRLPGVKQPINKTSTPSGNYVRLLESGSQRLEIDTSKLRFTSDIGEPLVRLPAVKASPANDRVALIRAPRSETNKGRDPQSRWYIRGVLHSHPRTITAGALFTLLLYMATPLAVVSSLLLLLSGEMPRDFGWVPGWLIAFPMALPLFGLLYLIWGFGGSCRICGQNLFRHGRHRKNSRAHHVPGLGYIFPLCFQILIFRWFRCTHCGTPVRLKE